MSKMIDRRTTRLGCRVTVMDHAKPHDEAPNIEIILETVKPEKPTRLRTEEWEDERKKAR